MTVRTAEQVAAEVAAVRAALPPLGAPACQVERVAADARLDVDTCIRRLARLCAAGEAALDNGYVRAAKPRVYAAPSAAVGERNRFIPLPRAPSDDLAERGDAWEKP